MFVTIRTRDTAGERGEVTLLLEGALMRALLLLALALLAAARAHAGDRSAARARSSSTARAPGEADQVDFEDIQPTLVAEGRVTAGQGCRSGEAVALLPAARV